MLPALAILAATAVARAVYPRLIERRQARLRPRGPDGVIIGAAPIDLPRGDAPGLLLIHGAGDTPQALEALSHHLHGRGFAVRVPLLSGHGRDLSSMADATATQWHDDVRRELLALHREHTQVGVVGLSMGGALAITLAAEQRIDALVLLAPYVAMPPLVRRMASTSQLWGWLLPYFSTMGQRSIRDPAASARALGHGILTPAALRALYEVMSAAVEALPRVSAPTLVLQSREDNRIPAVDAEQGFALLRAAEKELEWVTGAGHVISVDFGYQEVFQKTTSWLERHLLSFAHDSRGSRQSP